MIVEFWKSNENPITCYKSKPCVTAGQDPGAKVKLKKGSSIKQRITIEFPTGEKVEYPSVLEASAAVKINYNTFRSWLHGSRTNSSEYKIYRTHLNQ
jgi:hypothetical protein